jgi:L-ascorbate metabolism protein UlaG (beta-lactamase superfamily)
LIVQIGKLILYHSGDCVLYDGLVERLTKWKIDLALLPINGRDPMRDVPGNFNAEEAVRLGKAIHARLVVPCHYEMFEFNTVSPEGFKQTALELNQPHKILQCGERLDLQQIG